MATTRLAIPSKELQLKIVGPRDAFAASRVQRLTLTSNQPAEDKDELGNPQHVGQSKDNPEVTLTFSAFDVGIKIFAALTGTDPAAYPGAGVDISNLGEADAIIYVKDETVSDYVKSISGKRLQVRDFTYNYTVDGDSTEDYTLIGSERRYLKYDVVVDKFVSGTTSFTLTQTPIQLKNGNYAISVVLDGDYMNEVTGAPATGEYRLVGTTLTTGDTRTAQVLVVYHANPAGNNWSDIHDAGMPAAIRGRDVKISILANDIPRVQSVSINGTMNVQPVRELGSRNVVGYQRQVPTIEGTLTVLDTDLELISLLSTGEILPSGVVEFAPGEGCTTSGLSLKVELQDPCDDTEPITVVKTVYLPSVTIVGDSYTSNVNNNATQTFNFRSLDAQCIVYSGAVV
jgi:hypothetical protein